MAKQPKGMTLRDTILLEITSQLSALKGKELEEFLQEIGEDPAQLLKQHQNAVAAAQTARRRSRLDAARAVIRSRARPNMATIVSLDIAKKRVLQAEIAKRALQRGDMTLAARNRHMDAESDVDSFLEACVMLGLLDEQGNIKD